MSAMDPLAGSPWSSPETVAGFARGAPNQILMDFAAKEFRRPGVARALDLGCGAGRNSVPLAAMGWDVTGTDLSWPMLRAAAQRAEQERLDNRPRLILAPMHTIPARNRTFDFVVAHGIWNLARSTAEFRQAVAEAARVAKPAAALFVFTFSRNTLGPEAQAIPGEAFVFTEFSGQPQCFLTWEQLTVELGAVGFQPEAAVPVSEYNRPRPGSVQSAGGPVIYEAAFRRASFE